MPTQHSETRSDAMKKTAAKIEPPIDLKAIVSACVTEARYANGPAAELLIERGYADPRLYTAICREGFELLCKEMVGTFLRHRSADLRAQAERDRLEREAKAAKIAPKDAAPYKPKMDVRQGGHLRAFHAMAQHVSAAATMNINGYGRLCDMTFGQIRESATQDRKTSVTLGIRARYLDALYAARGRASDQTTSGSVISDDQFIAIYDKEYSDEAA